jgi:hypothetical protein
MAALRSAVTVAGCVLVFAATGCARGGGTVPAASASPAGPLVALDALAGEWAAEGPGFNTALTYGWLLEGRVLEATNEVHGDDGRVIARYRGMYAWDAGRNEIVFWTASESGEVHRGHAWWRDGVLWHEAEVSGGSIESYASAVRPGGGRLEFFASWGSTQAGPELLAGDALVYTRTDDPGR